MYQNIDLTNHAFSLMYISDFNRLQKTNLTKDLSKGLIVNECYILCILGG